MSDIELLTEDIETAARSVSRRWPGVIDADDLQQEIYVLLLERPGSLSKVVEMDTDKRRSSIIAIGHQIASGYRDDHDYFSGQFFYSTDDVRKILNRGVLEEEQYRTDTERIDVEEGLELLVWENERYAQWVYANYAVGAPEHKHWKDLTRAVDALTDCTNRVHNRRSREYQEGPGTRRVENNRRAQELLGKQHERAR